MHIRACLCPDIVRIRRDSPIVQAVLDDLYPMPARSSRPAGPAGRNGGKGRRRSVLDGLFNRRKGGRLA